MNPPAYLVWELHHADTRPALVGFFYSLSKANQDARGWIAFHAKAAGSAVRDNKRDATNLENQTVLLPGDSADETPKQIQIYVERITEGRR